MVNTELPLHAPRLADELRPRLGLVDRRIDLLLLGCGRVGQEVANLVLRRGEHLHQRYGLHPRWVGIADRSGFLLDHRGLHPEQVALACRIKAAGGRLRELAGSHQGNAVAMASQALDGGLSRPVLVDVSDADEGAVACYREALGRGCDVVTANKKPLAGPGWRSLHTAARVRGRLLRCEATVGAGLPVLDTLETLLASGDEVHRIEGSLSGTLGFVLAGLEAGRDFNGVVDEAIALGYAEPDPVADLAGLDVGRKALILARLAGWPEPAAVEVEGLVGPELAGCSNAELRRELQAREPSLRARLEAARGAGRRLRFVAVVEPGRAWAGLREIAADSPLANLESTDNCVVFHTARYRQRPLAVSGPGAGVEVTALGVFADILRVAAERQDPASEWRRGRSVSHHPHPFEPQQQGESR